mmetsp:Transcript_7844/g.23583  ORF Transcript_7844/g.23583 Transcript_7844/m.23583 type:complete len:251 (-) Transcript_7844:112-864(-)|eukprot:CAMPEP_0113680828 /NCGR_PEP_ID=MMETSP0038_2-20120614/11585_1 /TAXON_ID=2898 /ORGANISM="Cryptomonas paramecium" /LENGTH=250 /DNA_ID=CAMNT_0000599351 /DNA_START=219 /DNA_END=971 /DNA_ORIENTATION=+ /assembly_acc=CAM_ASM_000170
MPNLSSTHKSLAKRCLLTENQVKEIFAAKGLRGSATVHAASCAMARKYGVASKTIRDIWCGRCWLKTTAELWSQDDPELRALSECKRNKITSSNKSGEGTKKAIATAKPIQHPRLDQGNPTSCIQFQHTSTPTLPGLGLLLDSLKPSALSTHQPHHLQEFHSCPSIPCPQAAVWGRSAESLSAVSDARAQNESSRFSDVILHQSLVAPLLLPLLQTDTSFEPIKAAIPQPPPTLRDYALLQLVISLMQGH